MELSGEGYLTYNTKISILGVETRGYLCSSLGKTLSLQLERQVFDEMPSCFERYQCPHPAVCFRGDPPPLQEQRPRRSNSRCGFWRRHMEMAHRHRWVLSLQRPVDGCWQLSQGGGTVRCARAVPELCEKAILDLFPPMATVTAVATVFPDTGLLRFLLSPKTQTMS